MSRKEMSTIGAIVAAVLAVAGLAVVAFFFFAMGALTSFGSNK